VDQKIDREYHALNSFDIHTFLLEILHNESGYIESFEPYMKVSTPKQELRVRLVEEE